MVNKVPGYRRGPGRPTFQAWNWGPQELAYGFVTAESTAVEELLAQWRWQQGGLSQLPKKDVASSRLLSWLQYCSSLTDLFIKNVL